VSTRQYSAIGIAFWNGFVRLFVFSIIVALLSHIRSLTESLRQALAKKTDDLNWEMSCHQHTQDALSETEQHFHMLIESVRDCAIFMRDVDGNITSWNVGAQLLTRYPAEEALHRHFSFLRPCNEAERIPANAELAGALQDGMFRGEGWHQRPDGSRYWQPFSGAN
jgi:PAS domain S-box-containing protein